jgi:putative endonuclease
MSANRQALGRWGERLAAEYLEKRGYTVLGQNARTSYGEIDLVARQSFDLDGSSDEHPASMIVFVEVKTRSSKLYGMPEDSITAKKQTRMLESAQAYLQAHPELEGDWRIDVIAIQRFRSGEKPQITHFENVIRY